MFDFMMQKCTFANVVYMLKELMFVLIRYYYDFLVNTNVWKTNSRANTLNVCYTTSLKLLKILQIIIRRLGAVVVNN